jgi:hypothetical protein
VTKYWVDVVLSSPADMFRNEAHYEELFDRLCDIVMPFGCECELCKEIEKPDMDLSWITFAGMSGSGFEGVRNSRCTFVYEASNQDEAYVLGLFLHEELIRPNVPQLDEVDYDVHIEVEEDVDE